MTPAAECLEEFRSIDRVVLQHVREFLVRYSQHLGAVPAVTLADSLEHSARSDHLRRTSADYVTRTYWLLNHSSDQQAPMVYLRLARDKLLMWCTHRDPVTRVEQPASCSAEFALHQSNIAAIAYTVIAALTQLSPQQLQSEFGLRQPSEAVVLH